MTGKPSWKNWINLIEEKIRKFLAANRKYTNWKKVLNLYTPEEEDFLYKSIPLEDT